MLVGYSFGLPSQLGSQSVVMDGCYVFEKFVVYCELVFVSD